MNKSLDPNEVITTLQKRIEIKKQLRKSGELPPSEVKKLTKKKNDLDKSNLFS